MFKRFQRGCEKIKADENLFNGILQVILIDINENAKLEVEAAFKQKLEHELNHANRVRLLQDKYYFLLLALYSAATQRNKVGWHKCINKDFGIVVCVLSILMAYSLCAVKQFMGLSNISGSAILHCYVRNL